jgi:hypothetical protein
MTFNYMTGEWHNTMQKKSNSEEYTLYGSMYIKFKGKLFC